MAVALKRSEKIGIADGVTIQIADANGLLAVIAARAMNQGILMMSGTGDIAYHVLEATAPASSHR